MDIFDKFKRTVENAVKPKNARMQICMMGARGVGKTSVLTSMFNDLNTASVKSSSNLLLTTMKDAKSGLDMTASIILQKHEDLRKMFDGAAKGKSIPSAGISGDMDERSYYFQFGVKGKSARIDLIIKDFPGEYVETHPDAVRGFIADSNAIIVAIDTPHLMEENGRFNEVKNRVSLVTDYIKSEFAHLEDDKLVLFVPLKCERYQLEGRMDEVCGAVEHSYSELLDFFSNSSVKAHIAAAITPIFTVGEVAFSDFLREESGEVKTLSIGLPARAEYVYTKTGAEYRPKYCEQPLCYLLAFVTKLYQRTKSSDTGGFMSKLAAIFRLFPDDPELLLEIGKFSKKRVKDRDGYKILTGAHLM